uniref:Uncharacterized protein n=1 Tax=Knipowitschia caucasica TaxID=637954 RepID=A0AAV2K3D3_KNICA
MSQPVRNVRTFMSAPPKRQCQAVHGVRAKSAPPTRAPCLRLDPCAYTGHRLYTDSCVKSTGPLRSPHGAKEKRTLNLSITSAFTRVIKGHIPHYTLSLFRLLFRLDRRTHKMSKEEATRA